MINLVSNNIPADRFAVQNKSVFQTTTAAIRRMVSSCLYLVYAPPRWFYNTVYYYVIGYGKGAQAPSSHSSGWLRKKVMMLWF